MSGITRPGPFALLSAVAAAGLLRLSGVKPAAPPEPDSRPHNPEGFEEEDVDVRRTAFVVAGSPPPSPWRSARSG